MAAAVRGWFQRTLHQRELDIAVRADMALLRLKAPCKTTHMQYMASILNLLRDTEYILSSSSNSVTVALPDEDARRMIKDINKIGGVKELTYHLALLTVEPLPTCWKHIDLNDAGLVKLSRSRLVVVTKQQKIKEIVSQLLL